MFFASRLISPTVNLFRFVGFQIFARKHRSKGPRAGFANLPCCSISRTRPAKKKKTPKRTTYFSMVDGWWEFFIQFGWQALTSCTCPPSTKFQHYPRYRGCFNGIPNGLAVPLCTSSDPEDLWRGTHETVFGAWKRSSRDHENLQNHLRACWRFEAVHGIALNDASWISICCLES